MRRLRARLAASFHGLSADRAALALAVGLVLGTFPLYGCPTLLCAAASVIFGVNLPAVQVVNQLVTPLWWAMLVPFARLGVHIIPAGSWLLAPALHVVAGWLCVAPPAGIALYFAIRTLLRRFEASRRFEALRRFEDRRLISEAAG